MPRAGRPEPSSAAKADTRPGKRKPAEPPASELERGPFERWDELEGQRATPRGGEAPVELGVGVRRVVVERDDSRGARGPREGEQVAKRRVPPADATRVLLVSVLRVVDQEAGARGELEAGRPVRLAREVDRAERGLVVGQVGQRRVALADAEADRRARMADEGRPDLERTDPEAIEAGDVVQLEPAGEIAEADREDRGRQHAAQPGAQVERRRGRPP